MDTDTLSRESWKRIKAIIQRRDQEFCQYCGVHAPPSQGGQVDHILPLSKGGDDSLNNLAWSCEKCNSEKGRYTLREWLKRVQYVYVPPQWVSMFGCPIAGQPRCASVSPLVRCQMWLLKYLQIHRDGVSTDIVMRTAIDRGFSKITVLRARKAINESWEALVIFSKCVGDNREWILVGGNREHLAERTKCKTI